MKNISITVPHILPTVNITEMKSGETFCFTFDSTDVMMRCTTNEVSRCNTNNTDIHIVNIKTGNTFYVPNYVKVFRIDGYFSGTIVLP